MSVLFALNSHAALDPRKAITQYRHDVWSTEQGLPQSSVSTIVQTRDGYLWLGTELGLARFDGQRFTVFDQKNTPALHCNLIYSLLEDRQGSLWIGSAGGGLTRLRNGIFTTFTTKDGLSSDVVLSLHEDRAGALWIGTDGGGLNRLQNGRFAVFSTKNGLANDAVYAIAEDAAGSLWLGTHAGLSRLKKGRFSTYRIKDGLPNDYVRALYPDRNGGVWIGTNGGGLSLFNDERFQTYSTRNGLPSNAVWSLWQDTSGSLWIGTVGGGVSRLAGGIFTTYSGKDGLSSDDIWSLYQDRDGSVWIGTAGGGIHRLTEGIFTAWDKQEGMTDDVALPILEDRQGNLWIGTNGGGVNRFRDGRFTAITTKQGLADNLVFSIGEDLEGAIWFATRKGVNRLKNGILSLYTTRDGLPSDIAVVIYPDRHGSIWIGTRQGLSRFRSGKFRNYTTKDGMSNDFVQAILEDHSGALWIGTGGGGLNRLKDDKFEVFDSKRGLSNNLVTSIHEDTGGVLWVGTMGGGLNRLKDGRFTAYKTGTGLTDDAVFQILEDGKDNLWMSSNAGIFRVSKGELNDLAAGRIRNLSPVTYGAADGMKSKECNGAFQPAGWKARDGKLWFPTVKGVVTVDPEHLGLAAAPLPAFVEQAEIDRVSIDAGAALFQVPPGAGNLEIRYTAVNFLEAERTRFKYKLEGFDADWIDAGTRRTAYYTNIPPGSYRFRVIARNRDGVWSTSEGSLGFALKPHFFQTFWFYGLCFFTVVCLAAGLPILRVRQMQAKAKVLSQRMRERTLELQKETAERERVEQDLLKSREAEQASRIQNEFLANISHEIRTPIHGIRGMTDLTLRTELTTEQSENLITVRDCADALLTVVNDILDFTKLAAGRIELEDTEFNLIEGLQATVRIVSFQAQQKGLTLSCDVRDGVPAKIRGDLFRLRQVILNLLNNALKFTERGEVVLRVECLSRKESGVCLRFAVRDTGIGIPMEKQKLIFEAFSQAEASTSRRFGGTGLGLTISSRLVRMMGGELSVTSKVGCGSEFHFTVRVGDAMDPLTPNGAPTPLAASSAAVWKGGAPVPLRILLAEDNVVNQRVGSMLLTKRGHTPVVAANGREVLRILERESFDLILMDVQMPEIDGFEATAAIREEERRTGAHVPIVAVTAHATKVYEARCLEAGMDCFISKPFNASELFETIERLAAVAKPT